MRHQPQDHLPPRRALGDVRGGGVKGLKAETIREFFDFSGPDGPEKQARKVTRIELLAVLEWYTRIQRVQPWYMRLWLNLRRRVGSTPVDAAAPEASE